MAADRESWLHQMYFDIGPLTVTYSKKLGKSSGKGLCKSGLALPKSNESICIYASGDERRIHPRVRWTQGRKELRRLQHTGGPLPQTATPKGLFPETHSTRRQQPCAHMNENYTHASREIRPLDVKHCWKEIKGGKKFLRYLQCFPDPLAADTADNASGPPSSTGAAHSSTSEAENLSGEAAEMMCSAPGRERGRLRHVVVLAVLIWGAAVARNPRPDGKDNPCNTRAGTGGWSREQTHNCGGLWRV